MIHLHRVDPTRNMARFYTMALQPTLFGDWALLREWGRIGSAGRLVSSPSYSRWPGLRLASVA